MSAILVPVAPNLISEFNFLKKLYESLLLKKDSRFKSLDWYSLMVWESTIAPAASVGPSIPSVPTEYKHSSRFEFSLTYFLRNDNANSWFLPPSPLPFRFTRVSPPEIIIVLGLLILVTLSYKRSASSIARPSKVSSRHTTLKFFASARSASVLRKTMLLLIISMMLLSNS